MSFAAETNVVSSQRPCTFDGLTSRSEVDVGRVRTFWRTVERIGAGASIASGPMGSVRQIIVVSGWVVEMRLLQDGRRQIFGFLLPGDVAHAGPRSHAGSCGLMAVTNVEVADAATLIQGDQSKQIAAALNDAVRRRQERLFDHLVRIGRLTAKERMLNLLLELHDRLQAVGLVKDDTFRLPLTQEMFADALGLSVVHINRTLQQLRREGLLTVGRGTVTLHQREKLAALACYQPDDVWFGAND